MTFHELKPGEKFQWTFSESEICSSVCIKINNSHYFCPHETNPNIHPITLRYGYSVTRLPGEKNA